MHTTVAAAEESAEQPTHKRDDDRSEECAPETRHTKTGYDLPDEQQDQRIHDKDEKAEAEQNQWCAQDQQNRTDEGIRDAKQQRSTQQTRHTVAVAKPD